MVRCQVRAAFRKMEKVELKIWKGSSEDKAVSSSQGGSRGMSWL